MHYQLSYGATSQQWSEQYGAIYLSGIGGEYFQGYGSPFLLRRCQGPEHPKISQKNTIFMPQFWPGDVKLAKMASKRCQTQY